MELNFSKIHFCAIFIYFVSVNIKHAAQMPVVLDSADHASPKDLLADMLFKAAIVLNNPNKPFGDIGKRIGEIATKGIMEIENDLKPKTLKERLETDFESSSESESIRSSRQAPPPFPQIETAIKLIGLAINLGTTLLPGAILNVTTTANEQFAPAG